MILGWLGGAAKATADKTLEVSKATIETSRKVATSDDTKRVLATVARTPKNVGSWWERDARSWMNNVAARATGGTAVDKRGYPTAQMWTDPPRSRDESGEKKPDANARAPRSKNDDETSAENGSKAPGGGGRGHRALAAGKEEAGDVDEAFGFCRIGSKRSRPRSSRRESLVSISRKHAAHVHVFCAKHADARRHPIQDTPAKSRASRVSTHPSSFADEAMMKRSRDPSPRSCGAPRERARLEDATRREPVVPVGVSERALATSPPTLRDAKLPFGRSFSTPLAAG